MIDFRHVEKYRENNRIEAKRALGGLPYSVWETYSSFANTMGGVILLGVEEGKDKSFHAVDLPNPQGLIDKFWRQVNDRRRVNVNILTKNAVRIERVEGKRIVVIEVPRAHRADKPVYIENDMMTGTYRRGGEGDYRCTPEEIAAMRRDAAERTQDMRLLEDVSPEALCADAITAYREQIKSLRPGHALERCSVNEFLIQLGAAGIGTDGKLHPSAAGVLMFGSRTAIAESFPFYSVRLTEGAIKDAVDSHTSDNLFRFYHTVCSALGTRFRRSMYAWEAITEGLVNCLVNADYRERGGVTVESTDAYLRFSNPGAFRINPDSARRGGVSDVRNKAISHMFVMMGVGAGIGGGIPCMFGNWRKSNHPTPFFTEGFDPERTTLTLPIKRMRVDAHVKRRAVPEVVAKQLLAEHLTHVIFARASQISAAVGMSLPRVRHYLTLMCREGTVVAEGTGKHAVYKLRERAGR